MVWLFGVAALIVLWIMMCLPEESININYAANPSLWQLSAGSSYSQAGDSIKLRKGAGQLYLVIPQLNIDADYYDVGEIEGSGPVAYDHGSLLFISPYNSNFDYNYRYDYDTGNAGVGYRRHIDLKQHRAWQGVVKAVLILPASDAKQMSLKGIRFIHANPWTKIKAWWSGFTRYSDPLLGTCFVMNTPLFIGQPFNPFFVPILWALLGICGVITVGVNLLEADRRITRIAVGIFLLVIISVWGLLDLRNNVVYIKAISRNISLFWGKTIQERRGIVVGDPEFIDFMKFCDDNIPLKAKVFNQLPDEIPGTPVSYLSRVQYAANLRPRFYDPLAPGLSRSYFIYYKPRDKERGKVLQEQLQINEYLEVKAGEKLLQEVRLWRPAKYLSLINIWLREKDLGKANIEISLLGEDGKTITGQGKYLSKTGNEMLYRFLPRINSEKNERAYLQVENRGQDAIGLGAAYGEQYWEGSPILAGQKIYGDLAFRLVYRPKDLIVFKRFSENAYILSD